MPGVGCGGEERGHKKDSMILGLSSWENGVTIERDGEEVGGQNSVMRREIGSLVLLDLFLLEIQVEVEGMRLDYLSLEFRSPVGNVNLGVFKTQVVFKDTGLDEGSSGGKSSQRGEASQELSPSISASEAGMKRNQ